MAAPAANPVTPPAPAPRWEAVATAALLAWFAARVAFLALRLDPFVPPDEATHLGRILAYAATLGVPGNDASNFDLGLLDHRPWLYYWVMARLLAGNVLPLSDLAYLRLWNGALALATLWIGAVWLRAWCADPWARLLALAMASNTLMFTGIAAAVSYDNGANLLAAAALLAATRLRLRPSGPALLATAAWLLAGCLTKRSFAPLALLFALLLLLRLGRALPGLVAEAAAAARRPAGLALAAAVLVLGVGNAALLLGNLRDFGTPWPRFDQVVGEAAARHHRVHARDSIARRYREGAIDLPTAQALARQIPHPGDRQAALLLLRNAYLPESALLAPPAYAVAWARGMLASAVGYVGHRRALKSSTWLAAYGVVLAAAALLAVLRPRRGNGVGVDAALLAGGYALLLMAVVHYPAYRQSHTLELALQGRYLFPVWLPLVGCVAAALTAPLPDGPKRATVAGITLLFAAGDLPWLVTHVSTSWFTSSPV